MPEYNIAESVKAQSEYCKTNGAPHFAPRGGSCWKCNKNIYEPIERKFKDYLSGEEKTRTTGITVEEAGSQLVTGCPHCNRSYCD
ncbi:hypothetical protein MKY29_12990 [Psychrobacillus sp. FSL K6-2365]|uniref:hypothetical protein n=1 Tax=Psychrobacillus sp. FSL K6-2365 TaxID=2921546 RepID=UPI0030F88E2C